MNFIIEDMKRVNIAKENGKPDTKPNYQECIQISTNSSLKLMIAPGLMVILVPIVGGILFGPKAVEGILAGSIVSGVQVAISASNTGGAWDNCKREIEKNRQDWRKKQKSEGINVDKLDDLIKAAEGDDAELEKLNKIKEHTDFLKEKKVAAVVGDTVGDPLKDTSGPAINILIKLGAITSLVFGNYIKQHHAFTVKGSS